MIHVTNYVLLELQSAGALSPKRKYRSPELSCYFRAQLIKELQDPMAPIRSQECHRNWGGQKQHGGRTVERD